MFFKYFSPFTFVLSKLDVLTAGWLVCALCTVFLFLSFAVSGPFVVFLSFRCNSFSDVWGQCLHIFLGDKFANRDVHTLKALFTFLACKLQFHFGGFA